MKTNDLIIHLKDVFGVSDQDIIDLIGESVFFAMRHDALNFVTIGDLVKIADYFGLEMSIKLNMLKLER